MADPQIREVQVDALLHYGELKIEGHYLWQDAPNKHWVRIEIPVKNTKSASLKLVLTASREFPERFRFALLYNSTLPIRRLCAERSHRNKHTDRERCVTTHLHKWDDRCQDRLAYPTAISTSSIDEALEQFCAECNIQCLVTIADMPSHQSEMLL